MHPKKGTSAPETDCPNQDTDLTHPDPGVCTLPPPFSLRPKCSHTQSAAVGRFSATATAKKSTYAPVLYVYRNASRDACTCNDTVAITSYAAHTAQNDSLMRHPARTQITHHQRRKIYPYSLTRARVLFVPRLCSQQREREKGRDSPIKDQDQDTLTSYPQIHSYVSMAKQRQGPTLWRNEMG